MTGSTAPSALELIWNTSVTASLASSYHDSAAALLLIVSAAEEQQAQLRTSFEIRVSFHGDAISLHLPQLVG